MFINDFSSRIESAFDHAEKAFQAVDKFLPETVWNIIENPSFPFVTLTSTTNGARQFPPYSIIEVADSRMADSKNTPTKVQLEMAVAGYTKDRLKVELEGNVLIVQGFLKAESKDRTYRHKGIANSPFLRTFDMRPDALIEGVELLDGILTITVATKVPELKPRTTFEIK